ncbi:DUF397 domain-containing protein [Thermomonospora umbrina]|uniref:DUF397 domain-containing protein n=1 Tax=Thermomonospora umbrina TaxID=111806 RepID=UPI000E276BD0|nr:DUF397 domain-containing protein [Thermomonospora umbrina]
MVSSSATSRCPSKACIEVARPAHGTIGVGDGKNADAGPVLDFAPGEWTAFLHTVRSK